MNNWKILLILVVVLFILLLLSSMRINNQPVLSPIQTNNLTNKFNQINEKIMSESNSIAYLPIVNVDLTKYQGLWYEVARLPATFQRSCINTTATYTLNPDKTMNVTNQCQIENRIVRINGIAYPNYHEIIPGSNIYPGSFTVIFKMQPKPEKGEYNIILIDPEYRYALVGTKNRQNLWILSRTNNMEPNTYNYYVNVARNLGYPINNLVTTIDLSN